MPHYSDSVSCLSVCLSVCLELPKKSNRVGIQDIFYIEIHITWYIGTSNSMWSQRTTDPSLDQCSMLRQVTGVWITPKSMELYWTFTCSFHNKHCISRVKLEMSMYNSCPIEDVVFCVCKASVSRRRLYWHKQWRTVVVMVTSYTQGT